MSKVPTCRTMLDRRTLSQEVIDGHYSLPRFFRTMFKRLIF